MNQFVVVGHYLAKVTHLLVGVTERVAHLCYARTDNLRMTVDRKLTFVTVRHEVVNQNIQTESCSAGHGVCMLL